VVLEEVWVSLVVVEILVLREQNEAIALQPSQTDTVVFTCGKCMSCEQIFGCCKLRCCPTHLTPNKENCNAIASFCSGRGVGGVGILTTGAGAILADCLQEIHSNQLSFLGYKCIGQHRNLHQPQFCSHGKHLPQVQNKSLVVASCGVVQHI
jgi:hypothetical protein